MSTPQDKHAERPGWRIGVLYSRSGVTGTTESQHFFGTVLAVIGMYAQTNAMVTAMHEHDYEAFIVR